MRTYRVVARPDIRLAPGGVASLTEDLLAEVLTDAVVHELRETHWGLRVAELQLRRPTDAEALTAIESALEKLGFSLVEAVVRGWVTKAIERGLTGAMGGFVLGGGLSENAIVGLFASVVGGVAGAWTGAEVRNLRAQYDARRDYRGVWVLRELPTPTASETSGQPAFAVA